MFSSLVTATKTRYASLRGDEADGDTEDDSHVSRVLRTYYTEQGRPFPAWLGGGPQAQQQQQQQGVSLRRGQNPGGPQQGVKTTLSDIWDTPTGQQKPSAPPVAPQGQGQKPAEGMNKMRFFRRDQGSNGSQQMQHGRQHQASSGYDEPPPNQAAQSSVRDRLWSNRSGGNQAAAGRTPSPQLSAPTPPPQQQQYQAYNGGSGGGYGTRDKSPMTGNGYGGSGGRGGSDRPVMSATISFGQGDYEYGGYGGYSGTGGSARGSTGGSSGGHRGPLLGGGKVGLPSGPKAHR